MARYFGNRWFGLCMAIVICAVSGAGYAFAIYSPPLKDACDFDQKQLATLGSAKDIGENFGLLSGFLVDTVPAWAIFVTGVLHNAVGYGVLWLVASRRIQPLPFWAMLSSMVIGANAGTWINTAVLVVVLRNFQRSRGLAVGLLKGFIGLSGAIFTELYSAVYAPEQDKFLYMIAVWQTGIVLLAMVFVEPVEVGSQGGGEAEVDMEEKQGFSYIYLVCLTLAGYLLVAMVAQELWAPNSKRVSVGVATGMVLLLLALFAVPTKVTVERVVKNISRRSSLVDSLPSTSTHFSPDTPLLAPQPPPPTTTATSAAPPRPPAASVWPGSVTPGPLQGSPGLSGPRRLASIEEKEGGASASLLLQAEGAEQLLSDDDLLSSEDEEERPPTPRAHRHLRSNSQLLLLAKRTEGWWPRRRRGGPRRGENFTLGQALVKADFWLLFFTVMCGTGSGLTAVNNLAQMGEAQGFDNVRIPVALFSILNFLGRLGAGLVSERWVKEYSLPRPAVLLVAQLAMCVGHLLFAFAVPGSMYLGPVIVGFCYGAHWAIFPATASELFGLKAFGTIYNFYLMANPLGSYLFSGLLAGYIYDQEATKGPKKGGLAGMAKSMSGSGGAAGAGWGGAVGGMWNGLGVSDVAGKLRGGSGVLGGGRSGVGEWGGRSATSLWRWAAVLEGGGVGGWGGVGSPTPAPAGPAEEPDCVGAHCFKLTFLVMSAVCLLGAALSLILLRRTKVVYRTLYDKTKGKAPEAGGEGH